MPVIPGTQESEAGRSRPAWEFNEITSQNKTILKRKD